MDLLSLLESNVLISLDSRGNALIDLYLSLFVKTIFCAGVILLSLNRQNIFLD